MESVLKSMIVMLFAVGVMAHMAMGAGECRNIPVEAAAMKMAPCAEANEGPEASVSSKSCGAAREVASNPSCLCALIKLGESQKAFNPEAALTIPKRCNFQLKHSGYKCGSYTLP